MLASEQKGDIPEDIVLKRFSQETYHMKALLREETETDLTRKSMKIESIVQPINHYLSPDDSLSKVVKLLTSEGLIALPVISSDGNLLGLITTEDIVAASTVGSDSAEVRVIAKLVRPGVVTCTLAEEVVPLASQAKSLNHTHVVVVDELGNVVGIADLSSYQMSSHEVQHREDALDEALDETFPASDPISPS